jgi:PPE-repeat protein
MTNYGALPPEINSGRIYAGAGSAPMMAAATAWRGLAAELTSAAMASETVISRLTGEEWRGSASTAMAAAVTPYLAWMRTTASQAEHAATQATAGAAAFEAARAASVPPSVVAANRAQLAALVATNILGQNTAAIAANEAHYGAMWAQDAAAMYGYAGTSATAAQLTLFNSPSQTNNPAGTAGQAAAVTQAAGNGQAAQLISTMPSALQGLASPMAASTPSAAALPSGISSILDSLNTLGSNSYVATAAEGLATAAVFIPPTLTPTLIGYLAGVGFNAVGGGTTGAGLGALLAPGGPLGALGGLGGGISGAAGAAGAASAVTGTMGQASLVSSLSVPPSWAAATPASTSTAALQGAGWAVAPESNSIAAMPGGMPTGGSGRGSFGFGTPRYGFKLTVMPRPVMVG